MSKLNILRSEKHVVTLTQGNKTIKLFQISFGKDGSIFLHFPYHNDPNGLASIVELDKSLSYPANNVSMAKQGKVTSHRIKFSHHPDGRAHFSQDYKIFTMIKKQAVPLNAIEGHVFTISIQNPIGFFDEVKNPKDKHHYSNKRTVVNFSINGGSKTFKFIARWQSINLLEKELGVDKQDISGPQILRRLTPTPSVGFILGQPEGYPFTDRALTLCIEEVPQLDKAKNRGLIMFIGAFDHVDHVNDLRKNTTFLSLMYPTIDPIALKSKIGSIDLIL